MWSILLGRLKTRLPWREQGSKLRSGLEFRFSLQLLYQHCWLLLPILWGGNLLQEKSFSACFYNLLSLLFLKSWLPCLKCGTIWVSDKHTGSFFRVGHGLLNQKAEWRSHYLVLHCQVLLKHHKEPQSWKKSKCYAALCREKRPVEITVLWGKGWEELRRALCRQQCTGFAELLTWRVCFQTRP